MAGLALAGCGGAQDAAGPVPRHTVPPPTTPGQDAAARTCRWLDPVLVGQVMGLTAAPGRPSVDAQSGLRCTYLLADGVDAVVLVSYPTGGLQIYEAMGTAGRVAPRPVTGIGAAASWLPDLRLLVVRTTTGRTFFVQLATAHALADAQAKAERLARMVVPRAG
ncbi:MAG: hypothetical protein JWN46_361 [Acidimicrobiales bacterium]|nr:hypothetical protein [Acidimicrobiales bacterium]